MQAMPLGISNRQLGGAILAGGLAAAAFPPLGAYPLILVSMAMFLWLLRDLDQQTARNLGVVYGLTLGLGTMYWFFVVFTFKALPLIFLMALYFALLAQCVAMTRGMSTLWRILITAACAVGIEWLRGDAWYLRFPWYNAPHALALEPFFIAPVRWLGVYGFSFVLWAIAAAGVFWKPSVWLGLPILFVTGFLLPAFDAPNLKVLLVQAKRSRTWNRSSGPSLRSRSISCSCPNTPITVRSGQFWRRRRAPKR